MELQFWDLIVFLFTHNFYPYAQQSIFGAIAAALPAVIGGVNAISGLFRRGGNKAGDSATAPPVPSTPGPAQMNTPLQLASMGPVPAGEVPVPQQVPSVYNPRQPDFRYDVGEALGNLIYPGSGSAVRRAGDFVNDVTGRTSSRTDVVPYQGGSPGSEGNILQLLGNASGGRKGRQLLASYLLASGTLLRSGIIREPIVFQGPNGQIKYGSDLGFVIINRVVNGRMIKFQMVKQYAQTLGWWKPRKKPIISVRDSNALRRAKASRNKIIKLAKEQCDVRVTSKCAPRRRTATSKSS